MYVRTPAEINPDAVLGDVYILRFGQPLGNDKHSAEFYIGWAAPGNLFQRLEEHRAGQGAAITREAARRGVEIELVMSVPGTKRDERKFKNIHARRVLARFLNNSIQHDYRATFYDASARILA